MALERDRAFAARAIWVKLKALSGIPRSADKDFFCERIVRGMMQRDIHPDTQFSGLERRGEGFGSQALSRLTVAATAHALGYHYRHLDMAMIGHAEQKDGRWTERLEAFYGLGAGEIPVEHSTHEIIDYQFYAEHRHLWERPCLVRVRDFYTYTRTFPDAYKAYLDQRRETIFPTVIRSEPSGVMTIAVHVRRGDVSRNLTSHRYIANEKIVATLNHLTKLLEGMARPYKILILTNGSAEEFGDLRVGNSELIIGMGAIETLEHLISADILMTGNSSFSYLAALASRALILYEPQTHRPLSNWIVIRRDRAFSDDEFVAALNAKLNA